MSQTLIAEGVQLLTPKYLTGNVCCYETVAKYFQKPPASSSWSKAEKTSRLITVNTQETKGLCELEAAEGPGQGAPLTMATCRLESPLSPGHWFPRGFSPCPWGSYEGTSVLTQLQAGSWASHVLAFRGRWQSLRGLGRT